MKQIIRWSASLLAVALVFFTMTTAAQAKGKGKAKPKIPYTAIVSVDTTAMTITVEPKNSSATGAKAYKYSAKTVVTVNGLTSTPAGLVPGQAIRVGLGMDGTTAETLTATAAPADPK